MKIKCLLLLPMLMLAHLSHGQQIHETYLDYKHDTTTLQGFLAFNPEIRELRPVVIVVHEWTGINDHVLQTCRELAGMGYIAFAADVYGKGVRPTAPEAAAKESGKYKNNRTLFQNRMLAAFNTARALPGADPERIVVMGYCFGGTAALELARTGADVKGTVSFHGGLANPNPQNTGNIKGSVLILHGALDPHVPDTEVNAFLDAMNDAGVDYQFIIYSKAVHSFTNPSAGDNPENGSAYNKLADERSWTAFIEFLTEMVGD